MTLKKVRGQGLKSMFESCQSIHEFVERLSGILEAGQMATDKESLQRAIVKLEVELLKNWLANNSDKYYEILQLIGQKDNNLWRYFAKNFTYVLRKLKLLESIQEHHGRIPESDEYILLEEYLQNIIDGPEKIERLFVDRLHIDLMLNISEKDFANILAEDYNYFEENLHSVTVLVTSAHQRPSLQSIGLLSWLKYYAHMYVFALSNSWQYDIMLTIDRLLTNDESTFGATLKLFILKQLKHMNNMTLIEIHETFIQHEVVWLRPLLILLGQVKMKCDKRSLCLHRYLMDTMNFCVLMEYSINSAI